MQLSAFCSRRRQSALVHAIAESAPTDVGGYAILQSVAAPKLTRRMSHRVLTSIIISFPIFAKAAVLEIQLPPEVNAFKQDVGAEIANAQCLVCHSVEYVSTQPPLPREFWKSSIQKMQQKYGAAIPEAQVETLVEYLTRNYGSTANGEPGPSRAPQARAQPAASAPVAAPDGPRVAEKYGCLGCHNATVKIVGPAYREIAAKYKSDSEAGSKIAQQIHQGGSGKWGPIIMPPFPQVTASETKILTEWILGLK